jgi:hypothetical protein
MSTTALRVFLPVALAAALHPHAAAAGQVTARTEVTPFGGVSAGGGFRDEVSSAELEVRPSAAFGLMLDFPWEENSQLEIYLSRQPTRVRPDNGAAALPAFDLSVEYYHIGGTVMLDKVRELDTYLVATLGATRLDPKGSVLDPEIRFSLSLGLGAKRPIAERLQLRMEGRVFATAMDSDSTIFCNIPGTCEIEVKSDTLIQWQASMGLTFAF